MGKDGGCIGERGFSCDVANAGVLLNRRFPYLGGSRGFTPFATGKERAYRDISGGDLLLTQSYGFELEFSAELFWVVYSPSVD